MTFRTLTQRWGDRDDPPLILSIDNGTSGLGVLAVDALTMESVAASTAVGYGIYTRDDGSIKCQPFDAVIALRQAMQDLEEKLRETGGFSGNPLANVIAVGVVGHMHAGIWMGKLGMPVDLASMWNCPSAHEDGRHLTRRFGQRVARRLTLSHVRKELRTRPDWWQENVYSITTPAGFLTWWLTGVNAVGPGEFSGMGLLDPETGKPSPERFACLREEFGVDLTALAPRCVQPGTGYLRLTRRGLAALRLPPGANPVVMAGEGDQVGATEFFRLLPGQASGSFGTSGPINCVDDEIRQDEHLGTDNFRVGTGLGVLNMGLVVVCGEPIEAAARRYETEGSFAYINEQAKSVPMDCDGAIRIELGAPEDFLGFTTTFSASVDLPDRLSPGLDAQLAYLQTALITRHRLEMMGRGRGNPPSRFVVGGGPTQSDRFLETLATALNLQLEIPEGAEEATARGLADLIAYEEEAMARRDRDEAPPPIQDFLAELRTKPRPFHVVSPEAAWVEKLDAHYRKFVAALSSG